YAQTRSHINIYGAPGQSNMVITRLANTYSTRRGGKRLISRLMSGCAVGGVEWCWQPTDSALIYRSKCCRSPSRGVREIHVRHSSLQFNSNYKNRRKEEIKPNESSKRFASSGEKLG